MAADLDILSGTMLARLTWDFLKTSNAGGDQVIKDSRFVKLERAITEGTGQFQMDQLWADRRFVSAASPLDDIPLTGFLENAFGETVNFAKVKLCMIVNLSTTTGERLKVGGAASNPWVAPFDGSATSKNVCGPGSPLVLSDMSDGFTVVPATGDILRVAYAGSGGYISYDIVLVGTKG